MDLNKHLDFFNPTKISQTIHIVGLGAIGSNVAMQLVRLGFTNFDLYDFDTVGDHNITNQMFNQSDIKEEKIIALAKHMLEVNPKAVIKLHQKGWTEDTPLSGYLFLCVDSIEVRKRILEDNKFNASIPFVVDMRIGLEEAQMYASKWTLISDQKRILSTMQFKDADVVVPISSCGTQLTVLPTIQMIVSIGVMNLINFIKTGEYHYQSIVNSIQGIATSFK